jgi:hypothetical protein
MRTCPTLRRPVRLLLGALVAALVATACASPGPEDTTPATVDVGGMIPIEGDIPASVQATPQFLRSVADTTEASPSVRFELDMSMRSTLGGLDLTLNPVDPFAYGELGEGRTRVVIDYGVMIEAMMGQVASAFGGSSEDLAAELGLDDLTIEMVGDAGTTFIRMPMFGAIASLDPSAVAAYGPIGELGDGWGYVDNARLGELLPRAVLDGLADAQTVDPEQLAGLLRSVEGEVTAVGRTEIRNVAVTHLAGTVTLGDILASDGSSLSDLTGQELDLDAPVLEEVLRASVPIDVYVDDEGRLRRFAYTVDLAPPLNQAIAATGQAMAVGVFTYGLTVDLFDYDAEITVDLPSRDGAVDLTDWLLSAGVAG